MKKYEKKQLTRFSTLNHFCLFESFLNFSSLSLIEREQFLFRLFSSFCDYLPEWTMDPIHLIPPKVHTPSLFTHLNIRIALHTHRLIQAMNHFCIGSVFSNTIDITDGKKHHHSEYFTSKNLSFHPSASATSTSQPLYLNVLIELNSLKHGCFLHPFGIISEQRKSFLNLSSNA